MLKVYKYSLGFPGPWVYQQDVMLPEGAVVLSVDMQAHELMLWAVVDPRLTAHQRVFMIAGTNVDLNVSAEELGRFIGTVRHVGPDDRIYFWHVFELVDPAGLSMTFPLPGPQEEA